MLNIIVQAGGRGSRLRSRTWNKPKCLVPINGKPLIYHLFDKYSDAKFHIIGDYKVETLNDYLLINKPNIKYKVYKTTEKGTCSGVSDVINNINEEDAVVVTWGDIIYNKKVDFDFQYPTIFKTSCFSSRYRCYGHDIVKEKATQDGIAGIS